MRGGGGFWGVELGFSGFGDLGSGGLEVWVLGGLGV